MRVPWHMPEMGKNRTKRSFCAIAKLEERDQQISHAERTNVKKRRKSSLSALAKYEANLEDTGDELVLQCGQTKANTEDYNAPYINISKNDSKPEFDTNCDEDLFRNDSLEVEEYHSHLEPPSPPLMTPVTPNRQGATNDSADWGGVGDDSLVSKFPEEVTGRPEYHPPPQKIKSSMEENRQTEAKKDMDNPRECHLNDTFGDIDLTLLENQLNNAEPVDKTLSGQCGQVSISEANKDSSMAPDRPADAALDQHKEHVAATSIKPDNALLKLAPTVNDFVSNPSQPIAASTPHKPCGDGKLMDKLKERLKANANQQTTTSFHLRDASKIFPEIILEQEEEFNAQMQFEDIGPFYGLPAKVQNLMKSFRGINQFYDWQHKCLTLKSVLQGKNLIYSLPTSGGKTLVAEMLIMKELLCKKRDAILVLPFVAIVQEKVRNIAQFADELDFLVEEYAGSKGKIPPTRRRKRKSLFVCTIEKANSLVNSLIETERLDSIGMVVVDELHMLGEGGRRGAIIEMMLAKTLHVSSSIQIIGMSATLSNISDLAEFLRAEVYTNDFRPVALDEHIKVDDSIYKVNPKKLNQDDRLEFDRAIGYANKEMSERDTDHLATLVIEVVPEHSCLVFCATKKNCENVALMISKLLPEALRLHKTKEKKDILQTLYHDSGGEGICPTLSNTIPCGVAYHHSGLTADERRLIEGAFIDGVLCMIACTSTLAAGVNLPARRVIIRSPYVGRNFLSRSQYKQMVGRAGRAGIDTKGESFLILTKKQDKQKVIELVTGPVEICLSSLMYDKGKGFKTLLLNLVWLKVMTKLSDIKKFFRSTLISIQLDTMPEKFSHFFPGKNVMEQHSDSVEDVAKNALQDLLDLKLIKLVKLKTAGDDSPQVCNIADCALEVTKLGVATNRGSIDLSISNGLYSDLRLGLQSLVLSSNLHLLYLITPRDAAESVKPHWMIYFEEYGKLTPDEQQAAAVIGVPENFVALKAAGRRIKNKKSNEGIILRFYVTLMLHLLFRGRSVWEVAGRFEQPRGFLQNLVSSSAAFASCVLHFTKELEELWPYHALLERLVQSLQYCTTAELLPLMEIPGVKVARAKQLFRAGFKTLTQIAKADATKLMKNIEYLPRKQALQIIASSKVLLKEKIEDLRAEVEELQEIPDI